MFKVNNKDTKTPERRQWVRFGVFIIDFEHISHLVLEFLLLTLSMQLPTGKALEFADELNTEGFQASEGWLRK